MGRLRAKQDYESLRNARITRNKARLESAGISRSAGESPVIISSAKSIKRVKQPTSDSATAVRRSVRLNGGQSNEDHSSPQDLCKSEGEERSNAHVKESPLEVKDIAGSVHEQSPVTCKTEGEARINGCLSEISDYERLRLARISENKARMASLGLDRSIKELQDIFSSPKSNGGTEKRAWKRRVDLESPRRRSDRLKGKSWNFGCSTPKALPVEWDEPSLSAKKRLFSSSDRCGSKGRGSIYDPVLGICCHFCRQKKLCGEEDCKRCGDRDINEPCIGKTECSVCHSTNGVLCRACLKVRYGEEMEEVRKNKDWMCPHCIEEKGIKPHWICNSSLCLKKKKMVPTGIAIFRARAEGYESVAHLIMDKLKCKAGC